MGVWPGIDSLKESSDKRISVGKWLTGKVKVSNAKEIVSLSNVDGALIGGASLKSDDFTEIIAD